MPLAGFEPTIPVFKRAKTFHTLDRAATVTGRKKNVTDQIIECYFKMSLDTEFGIYSHNNGKIN
jgi:hypothetical protein